MAPEKGKPRQGLPPDDGRQWLCRQQITERHGWSPATITRYAQKLKWTCHHTPLHCQHWYLESEVTWYATFLKRRDQWRKRRQPKHWEMEYGIIRKEDTDVFLTTLHAAAFLGVSIGRVRDLARRGKLAVYFTGKPGRGSRYYFSVTNLRYYRDDEDRLKRRATYDQAMQTRKRRKLGLEFAPVPNRRRCKVPEGWLLAWQVAERAGVSETVVNRWRRKNYINCERFEYRRKHWTPWCYSEAGVEEFLTSELYQEFRQRWEARKPKTEERLASPPRHFSLQTSPARSEAFQESIRSRMEW